MAAKPANMSLPVEGGAGVVGEVVD